jgi:2-(1,2-epoxy-1,2-dihydrophenyl)acetyl-CoA isomerase
VTDDKPLDEQVLHRVEDGVSWITLNRPEAHNAITPDQRNRVIDLLAEASEDLAVRAVVLTATGKGFCTGADLRAGRAAPHPRPEGAPERVTGEVARLIRDGAQRLIAAILDCEKPVIGAINGTAAGIGAHMAFACDLVIAAERAKFVEVFVRRGLVPDGGGAYLLPRLIGVAKTKELMFFGDALSAREAEAAGLVNAVVPDDELTTVVCPGGPVGRRSHPVHLTHQVVGQPLARVRPFVRRPRRGNRGPQHAHLRCPRRGRLFVERRDPEYHGW